MCKPLRICRKCGTKAMNLDDLPKFKKDTAGKHGRANLCNSCRRLKRGVYQWS